MPTPPLIEQAKAYLHAQMISSAPAGVPGLNRGPFVTISREAGAGGSTIARLLADRLNERLAPESVAWTIFDQNLIEHVLHDAHLSPRLAQFLPEDKVSEVHASVGELVGLHPNLWSLIQKASALMRELARRGHVILVGRGANFATTGVPRGVHVRLVASPEQRAQHMAARLGLGFEEAMARNRRVDSARRDYVRSVFDADVGAAAAYDAVLNTGRIGHGAIVQMIVDLLAQHEAAPPAPVSSVRRVGEFRASVGPIGAAHPKE